MPFVGCKVAIDRSITSMQARHQTSQLAVSLLATPQNTKPLLSESKAAITEQFLTGARSYTIIINLCQFVYTSFIDLASQASSNSFIQVLGPIPI